jgi:hypothetical protein
MMERSDIDADEIGRDRIGDHGAETQSIVRAINRELHGGGEHERAHEHDQMIGPHEERPEVDRPAAGERRKRIGVARQDEDRRLLQLHPDRKARDHGGDAGAGLHRRKAETLHINAGDHGADHNGGRDGKESRVIVQIEHRAEIGADHDGRAVGQVQAAHDAEDQGEADREQPVGRADHDAIDRVLDEVDHRPLPSPAQPAARRVPR